MFIRKAVLACAAGAGVCAPSSARASSITITNLSALSGPDFSIQAINDSGQVAGYQDIDGSSTDYTFRAFSYDNGNLNTLGTLGGAHSSARGISPTGQIVGESEPDVGLPHAFLYSNGVMTDLGILGPSLVNAQSFARGINSSGQIVGNSTANTTAQQAFLYSNGTMTGLGTLGGFDSFGEAINESGQIAGTSATPDGRYHAFRYDSTGMHDLGALGGSSSYALDINASGQVVGEAMINSTVSIPHAFIHDGTSMIDLGTLPGGTNSNALAINDAGYAVGYSNEITRGNSPVIWTPEGEIFEINSLLDASQQAHWTIQGLTDISNTGLILAYGKYDGQNTNFILETTFVPEPASLAILGAAAIGILARRRRHSIN